eukprot:CAMPEP_0197459432 /NCGR_PEP_ID=MMETSP1175-20131217/51441_1 /TAXON_ID=1003142 /ORGANISM="Triceratium dubium, Strain CCMP147" /LENGTH=255 /DNA_ID=CAMNT_0042994307 /DNA_START=37 /DNA_END=804 /DNA_ORIENTATION=+
MSMNLSGLVRMRRGLTTSPLRRVVKGPSDRKLSPSSPFPSSAAAKHRKKRKDALGADSGYGVSGPTREAPSLSAKTSETGRSKAGPVRFRTAEKTVKDSGFWGATSKSATTAHRIAKGDHEGHKNIVAIGGRIKRKDVESSKEPLGGSVAASMSATTRHRLSRQGLMKESKGSNLMANPSSLHIPVTNAAQQVELPKAFEAGKPEHVSMEEGADSESMNRASHFAAVFVAVLGGATTIYWTALSPGKSPLLERPQ